MTFNWENSMSVGIRKFDEQHQKLISHINELFKAMSEGRGKDQVTTTIDSLTAYTLTHFRDEEEAMASSDFAEYSSHKDEHEYFIQRLQEFREKQERGALFLSSEMLEFLQIWLTDHIMGTDKRYSRYLNRHGLN